MRKFSISDYAVWGGPGRFRVEVRKGHWWWRGGDLWVNGVQQDRRTPDRVLPDTSYLLAVIQPKGTTAFWARTQHVVLEGEVVRQYGPVRARLRHYRQEARWWRKRMVNRIRPREEW